MINFLTKKPKYPYLIALGTGTSTGVPMLGCNCPVCTSPKRKNKRLRTSFLLVTSSQKHILIDATPDLRTQLLSNRIQNIDSLIITHDHADHVHGIDDVRPFCFAKPPRRLPVYTGKDTKARLIQHFPYIFDPKETPTLGGGIPLLDLEEIAWREKKIISNEEFIFFPLPHGHLNSMAFIHQKLGIISDCSEVPEEVVTAFKEAKLKILIIDCLRQQRKHSTHLILEEALAYAEAIGAEFTGLVHHGHQTDHYALSKELNKKYRGRILPLYDGQILSY